MIRKNEKGKGERNIVKKKLLADPGRFTVALCILICTAIILSNLIVVPSSSKNTLPLPHSEILESLEDTIAPEDNSFAGGSGTEDDPYQIEDWHHLNNVRDHLDANFTLVNALDEDTEGYMDYNDPDTGGWPPIGDEDDPFTGTFDGQGYTITGLYARGEYTGLFGVIGTGSTVRNVGLSDVDISGSRCGALVGMIEGGTVDNSHATGTVSGGFYVGGLVGGNFNGTVSNSYAAGTVGTEGGMTGLHIGGLMSVNSGGVVSNSYFIGNVSGQDGVGGLISLQGGLVENSYVVGTVHGAMNVGRLVAGMVTSGTVVDSFALEGDYPLIDHSSGELIGRVTDAPEEHMKDIRLYTDDDFGDYEPLYEAWDIVAVDDPDDRDMDFIWNIVDSQTYPFLSWQDEVQYPEFTLEILTEGNGTTYPPVGNHTYNYGQEVVVEAIPDEGWQFSHWSGDVPEEQDKEITIVMDEDKTITAHFQKIYHNLSISVVGEGSTDPSAGDHIYAYGTSVNITATPNEGWYFSHWTGDVLEGQEESEEVTIIMDGNKTLTAHFEQFYHDLNITVEGEGRIEPGEGNHFYAYGTEVSITAIPAEGWYFSHWTGDVPEGDETNENITVIMDDNKTLTAHFQQIYYNLSITVEGEGTTEPGEANYTHAYGAEVTITATADEGWYFSHWSGDVPEGEEYDEEITVIMDDNRSLTAHFERREYSLNISVGGEGTTMPSVGDHTHLYEDEVNITAIPDEGWYFSHWSGDVLEGEEHNESITIFMDDNRSLTAHFGEIILPSIEIISPDDGRIIDEGTVTVEWECEEGTYPISHYEVRINDGDWIDVGMDTQYTFEGLDDGEYTVTVRAFDDLGNYSMESIHFTVDTGWGQLWILPVIGIVIVLLAMILSLKVDRRKKTSPLAESSAR